MSEPYSETQKRITKESVFIALCRLLEKKAFNDITITEITKIAGVSRAAFYRNYTFKEDIIKYYLDDIFLELREMLTTSENSSKSKRTRIYFEYFKIHSEFIQLLIKADLTALFYDSFCFQVSDFFRNFTSKTSPSEAHEKYLPNYIASGLFGVLIEWIKSDMKESVSEISEVMDFITK